MAYTTINKSTDYFNTKLYTGNGGTQSITGVGFQPDWVWYKNRSATANHGLFDAVRGATKLIQSNSTGAEQTVSGITSFNSDGFGIGADSDGNGNGNNIVAWNWKANGAGSSNTDGAITSTVSANTTSGFSIVKWTANGANGNVVGHGLGATPQIVIYKKLTGTNDWYARINGVIDGSQDYFILNSTNGKANDSSDYPAPTNTLMTSYGYSNGSSMIAYAFAEKTGYSKIGSYTGNGSADGAFVYTGFKPAVIIIKRAGTGNWNIIDNKRLGRNPNNPRLAPNANTAEDSADATTDILSNGFKLKSTSQYVNYSTNSYIYMAFAEAPIVGTNNVPCTAR